MAAFKAAVEEWGADMLELDVRLSKDGHVMVVHDATVDRTTDGAGAVADFTRKELQSLDAGYHFVDSSGHRSFRGRGVTIPTLEELMDACPDTWLNVEAKEAQVAAPLVELVRRRGETHRVLVAAEHDSNRAAVRGYEGPWGASRHHCILFWIAHHLPGGGPYTPAVDVFQIPERWKGVRVLTPRLVREAHRRNIPVHVWTVDDPADMRRLLDWGVDGIQSDRPDLLSDVLVEQAGRPLPPCRRSATGRTSSDDSP
ncbi:MAG: glycerophosphodiester phosphodiesterase [Gemmatimonadetes bacterium]|nr:glycerophosphodiester phosphodiesterase [Gemmatimonadota bacterium]NNF12563.1 glycerophosphodiester phosphodiesterase [Gemmatimonadota bacterium]